MLVYVTFHTDTAWGDVVTLPRPTGEYEWRNLMHHMTLPFGARVVFGVHFEPHLHWHNLVLETHAGCIECDDQTRVAVIEGPHCRATVEYRARKAYDAEYKCMLTHMTLSALRLEFVGRDAQALRRDLLASENHKVVAVITRPGRHYLGRAQRIHTTEYGGQRTYTWQAAATGGGAPLADFHAMVLEEALDMERIREYGGPLTSAREHAISDYIPDNDRFSNANAVLPVTLPADGGAVYVQFYNLKTRPAAFGEVHVRAALFVSHGRPIPLTAPPQPPQKPRRLSRAPPEEAPPPPVEYELQVALSKHVNVRFLYTLTATHLRIARIELEARAYLMSLMALGAGVAPNSV